MVTFNLFSFILGAGSFGILTMMFLGIYAYFKTFRLNKRLQSFETYVDSEFKKQKENISYLNEDFKSQLKEFYNETNKIKNEISVDIDNQRKEFDQILDGFQVELKTLKTPLSN